jgi:hypothetical protein
MRSISHLLVGLTTSLLAAGSLQAQVLFEGTTTGCFYQGNGSCSAVHESTVGPLKFTGTNFSVLGGPGGVINLSNIGTFFLGGSPDFNFTPNGSNNDWHFRLYVSFSSPVTTPSGSAFTADFDGTTYINSSGDELDIEFGSSSQTFEYAGGEFKFEVDDVKDLQRYKAAEKYWSHGQWKYKNGQSGLADLTGEIECKQKVKVGHKYQYVSTCGPEETIPEPSIVPEPSSLLLLASGMFGFAMISRRRRNA